MIYIVQNLVPILAATAAMVVVAALWWKAGGHEAPAPGVLATAIVADFWLTAILAGALILAPPKGGVWTMTLGSAFVIWIGFVLPAIVASYRLRGLAWRAALADSGMWLAGMLAAAAVLRLIGLVAPPA